MCSNFEKFSFGMNWVKYLGYIIDEKGAHVDSAKIQFIPYCPPPPPLDNSHRSSQLFGPCKFLSKVHVRILPYHLVFEPSYQGQSESKGFLVWGTTKSICWAETLPLICANTHISIPIAKLRQMPLTMLLVQFSPSKGIVWPIIVRHSLILFKNTPPMIRICTPWCRLVDNGNITF